MRRRGHPEFPPPSRILITQLRRIGDALLCSPAVRALATQFPNATIDFMAESPAEEVFRGNPHIREVIIAPPLGPLPELFRFARMLHRRRYDWVIDFFSNPRSAQLVFATRARVRIGLDRFGRRWAYTHRIVEEEADRDLYAVDLRLHALSLFGVGSAGRELEIYADRISTEETTRALSAIRHFSNPIAAVAIGNPNPAKLYPPDLAAELITELQRAGFAVIATSGPGESELAVAVVNRLPSPVPYLADARVSTLTALYRHAAVYVGPDSAPKHIAAACGIPTVAFFGAGRPANWHDPDNPNDMLIIAPCERRPHCTGSDCAERGCLRKIPPRDIVQAVTRLMPQ